MAGETMLSALAEESSPPSSCLQPRSLSDPPPLKQLPFHLDKLIRESPVTSTAPSPPPRLELDPNPGCKTVWKIPF